MNITENQILQALSTVEDPDLKKDLVTLGMITNIIINDNNVSFTVVLTTPACPLKELIKQNCISAIHEHISSDIEVTVNLTATVTSGRNGSPILPHVKNIIAVASGKGGVGKSTVTTHLAIALAQAGSKVGLIDADIYGPSIPVMFGIEHEKPLMQTIDGKDYIVPIQKFGVKLMSIGLLVSPQNAVVWRGPMASSALRQFITDVLWNELDYLFIDLPPGTGDIHLTLVQTVPVTGAVIVTTPQKVSVADAQKGLSMFTQPQINVPVLGVVENMSYFIPEELPDNKYYIFGKDGGKKLASDNNVPFLGQIPLVQSIRQAADEGHQLINQNDKIFIEFNILAQEVARQVALRNATIEKTNKVEIKV
ncbi:MAG: Mrp/NBP35 family ATP-binding protein [Cytophagales bacterium]|nr:Mrp/NBP35 family ATP-binding protein [Cytophagales bacterium]